MHYSKYNRKGFLVPDSIRSCASFHAKILPTGEYRFRIHDCITGIRLRGDLNSREEAQEACVKLTNLSAELVRFAEFIRKNYADAALPKFVNLAGAEWCTGNLTIGAKSHFTCDEARRASEEAGLRLPTIREYSRLCRLPHTWDAERKGFWFAESEADLMNPERSVFFPAAGFGAVSCCELSAVNAAGCYRSGSVVKNPVVTRIVCLGEHLLHTYALVPADTYLSVRCVGNDGGIG